MESGLANNLLEAVLKFIVEGADLGGCNARRGFSFKGFDEAGWLWLSNFLAIRLPEDETCFLEAKIRLDSPILAKLLTVVLEDCGLKASVRDDNQEIFLELRSLDDLLWLLSEEWREKLSSAFKIIVRRLEL